MSEIDLTQGVDGNRIVEDLDVETYHCELTDIIEANGFLRIIGDNDFTDVEIRVPFDKLRAMGWQRSDVQRTAPDEASQTSSDA